MVAIWVVIGLIVSAVAVSVLGAAFSIFGLRDLFSGAALAVAAMAAALELAKFTLAAYLHQRWQQMHGFFKAYLVASVAVLSLITSMGIYGFLSNAYQSASVVLETEQVKLDALKGQISRNQAEIDRLNRTVEEIPANRVTKRMEARKELEPAINELNRISNGLAAQVDTSNLKILEVKQKVGPLIYISRAFKVDIDDVVKYLMLILVFVFDPLAICLVVATSEALQARGRKNSVDLATETEIAEPQPEGHVVHMRFASDDKDEKAV